MPVLTIVTAAIKIAAVRFLCPTVYNLTEKYGQLTADLCLAEHVAGLAGPI